MAWELIENQEQVESIDNVPSFDEVATIDGLCDPQGILLKLESALSSAIERNDQAAATSYGRLLRDLLKLGQDERKIRRGRLRHYDDVEHQGTGGSAILERFPISSVVAAGGQRGPTVGEADRPASQILTSDQPPSRIATKLILPDTPEFTIEADPNGNGKSSGRIL